MSAIEKPVYQLTRHPVGSLREIWALSWPLMLAMLSASVMYFVDRLVLANYNPSAMNASATAGITCWALMILPLAIVETGEVFVGRFNGEGKLKDVGRPVWQMIWFSLLLAPIFSIGARFLAPLIFAGTGNTQFECEFFIPIMDFAPCMFVFLSLNGFFIGTGRMKIVTATMVLANLINIGLGIVLVFGLYGFPQLGCTGSALATGISQFIQMLLIFCLFSSKKNRETYGTSNWAFDKILFIQCLKIAVPSGIARLMEVGAHAAFFRIMNRAGFETMTCVTMVQSLFLLIVFIVDGLSKGAMAVYSNLIGAAKQELIPKVLRSCFLLHGILTAIIASIVLGFTLDIASFFFMESGNTLLQSESFVTMLKKATLWMMLFFLFDGLAWSTLSYFTSAGQTKFIMYTSAILNWFVYLLPVYILVEVFHQSGDMAWMVLAFYNVLVFSIYFLRFRSQIQTNLTSQPEGLPAKAL